jgi:hypothetical protein
MRTASDPIRPALWRAGEVGPVISVSLRYLPESQPPASGLYGITPIP